MKNNFSTYKFQNEWFELEIYRRLQPFRSFQAKTICKLNFNKQKGGRNTLAQMAVIKVQNVPRVLYKQ